MRTPCALKKTLLRAIDKDRSVRTRALLELAGAEGEVPLWVTEAISFPRSSPRVKTDGLGGRNLPRLPEALPLI